MTTADSFNPTDAEGLAAWFARAEDNATRLRQRLIVLGGLTPWRDLPEPEPVPEPICQEPKSGPAARGAGQTHFPPVQAQAPVDPGNRPRRREQNRRPPHG
jgi:hypothetical protein